MIVQLCDAFRSVAQVNFEGERLSIIIEKDISLNNNNKAIKYAILSNDIARIRTYVQS